MARGRWGEEVTYAFLFCPPPRDMKSREREKMPPLCHVWLAFATGLKAWAAAWRKSLSTQFLSIS